MLLALLTSALLAAGAQPDHPRRAPPAAGGHGPMMNMSDADQKALAAYDLSEGTVKKAIAVHEKMGALPEERRRQIHETAQGAQGLDQTAKVMESTPEVASVLKSEGISAHDLLFTSIAMSQATVWSRMSQKHANAPMPPSMNPKNVEFAAKHQDLAEAWGKQMQKMGGMHGGPGGGMHGGPGAGMRGDPDGHPRGPGGDHRGPPGSGPDKTGDKQ